MKKFSRIFWPFEPHEYWPAWIFYAPVVFDYLRFAAKFREPRYPLVVNPGIFLSGLVGESKWEILQRLPRHAYPETLLVSPSSLIPEAPCAYPLVAKPDQGERGHGIRYLASSDEWRVYHARAPRPYLIQAFVSAPFEVGVLFHRSSHGLVLSSLGIKVRAEVMGDGVRSLEEICLADDRYRRQVPRLKLLSTGLDWKSVPKVGETVTLDEIRNHRRGARFEDGRSLITAALARSLEDLIPASSGIVYGRADIRCASPEALMRGETLRIVEVNGITGEPAEIYDPQMRLSESLEILRRHWKQIAALGERALLEGQRPPSWKEIGVSLWRWKNRSEFFDR